MSAADKPHIPAPGRDMANVEPRLPPAEDEGLGIGNSIVGFLTIAFGLGVCLFAILAAVFEASPLPATWFDSEDVVAAILAFCSGLCFIGCGQAIRARSLMFAVLLLIAAVILGAFSSAVL